ncbi:phosphoenolpyruvate carboxylase, partial [Pseudomonas sp. NPDC089569]|uniref:phosphoenolpyruvate carboxylase n=1 Tax=Pseudomonas sp. NPDC089569 TaxID=3390722 RepID=UPI003D0459B9
HLMDELAADGVSAYRAVVRENPQFVEYFRQSTLVSLSGDFMPGVSRDEAILGKDSGTTVTAPAEKVEKPKPEKPVKPGSLLDQIQKEVDGVETVPVPTPEPLETSPQ